MQKLTAHLVKQVNKFSLFLALGPFLLAVIITFFCSNLIYNAICGPFPVDQKYLSSLKSAWSANKYYVSLKGSEIVPTPYVMVQTRKGETPDPEKAQEQIAALIIPPRLILVQLYKDQKLSTNLTGKLTSIDRDLLQLFEQDNKDNPDLVRATLPFMLDARDNIGTDLAIYAVFAFALLAAAAYSGIPLLVWQNAEKHPVNRALKKFGDLREITATVDSEGLTAANFGPAVLTHSFFFFPKLKELVAIKLSDIVWAYRNDSENEVKKPSDLTIWTRDGKKVEIMISKNDIDRLLKSLQEKNPHAYFGFDPKLWLTWRSKPQTLVDEVDARRNAQA
ncbi:MAG: hypothetical protein LCH63_11795 [Candidatus Melainabacteria bacterium]|nr:hypothetical protein [Candidatus Melainabacteria bacterium]